MEDKTIAIIENSRALVEESMTAGVLSDIHIQARVNMIQGAIKNIFKKDVHYGIIPGTKKPTLYQPGADQLLVMFRIAATVAKVEDLSTADSIRYRVTVGGTTQNGGQFLGAGIGECSSDEEKYKWRRPVCDAEFNEAPVDRRREVWKSYQTKTYKQKQVRTNPSDVANTILKMATKRGKISMALTVTGAADAFSQDLEELPAEILENILEDEDREQPAQAPKRASEAGKAPAATPAAAAPAPAATAPNPAPISSGAQAHAEMVERGEDAAGEPEHFVKGQLKDVGFTKLPQGGFDYHAIVEDEEGPVYLWFRDKDLAKRLNGLKGQVIKVTYKIVGARNEILAVE